MRITGATCQHCDSEREGEGIAKKGGISKGKGQEGRVNRGRGRGRGRGRREKLCRSLATLLEKQNKNLAAELGLLPASSAAADGSDCSAMAAHEAASAKLGWTHRP